MSPRAQAQAQPDQPQVIEPRVSCDPSQYREWVYAYLDHLSKSATLPRSSRPPDLTLLLGKLENPQ